MLSTDARTFWQRFFDSFQKEPVYHSKFGGLWIDRSDWRKQLRRKKLPPRMRNLVKDFVQSGYVILPQACDLNKIDVFQQAVARAFREGNPSVLYQEHIARQTKPLVGPVDRLGTRVVDAYVSLPEALDLFTSPPLMDFLKLIFAENPLLFQSLSFDQGSQQGLHQDTAYVVANRPLEIAAWWNALEDVQEGFGELMYAPGSHRLPDWPFSPDRKHWNGDVDGRQPHYGDLAYSSEHFELRAPGE